jgi:putative alpha-1,2-mannosidase
LNGKELDHVWFQHAAIAEGGLLELIMGDHPQTSLGAKPSTFPPASITIDPEKYAGRE